MIFSSATSSLKTARFFLVLGLCAALWKGAETASAGTVVATLSDPSAEYSKATAGFLPTHLFATESGLYVLDTSKGAVRVYARGISGKEIQTANRFNGTDSDGNGLVWSQPVALAKCPGANLIAVLDACVYNESLNSKPTARFYRFEEQLNAKGELESVRFVLHSIAEVPAFQSATDIAFYDSSRALVVYSVPDAAAPENVACRLIRIGDGAAPVVDEPSYLNVGQPISGIDIDPVTGDLFAAVPSRRVVVRFRGEIAPAASAPYAPDQVYGELDKTGTDEAHFNTPRDVSVWYPAMNGMDSRAVLAVSDVYNNRISFFDVETGSGTTFGKRGSTGSDVFVNPDRVAVFGDDTFIVSDAGNRRLRLYTVTSMNAIFPQPLLDFPADEKTYSPTAPDASLTLPFSTSNIVVQATFRFELQPLSETPAGTLRLVRATTDSGDYEAVDGVISCVVANDDLPGTLVFAATSLPAEGESESWKLIAYDSEGEIADTVVLTISIPSQASVEPTLSITEMALDHLVFRADTLEAGWQLKVEYAGAYDALEWTEDDAISSATAIGLADGGSHAVFTVTRIPEADRGFLVRVRFDPPLDSVGASPRRFYRIRAVPEG